MSEVQEATEFILIGKIISRNVLIDGCFIITHAHAFTLFPGICIIEHTLSLSLSLLKQGFLLLPLCALQASWSTAFWLIPLPLPPVFSEESWITDACFHVHSLRIILLSLPPIFSEESWIIDTCFHVHSLLDDSLASVSHLFRELDYKRLLPRRLLMWVLEAKLGPSGLSRNHLYTQSHLPAQVLRFLTFLLFIAISRGHHE